MTDHPYYGLFLIMFYYGLRRGEAFGLRWKDIDFTENTIHIRQQVYLVGHEPKIGSLKTRASVRDLPPLPSIKQELQAEYERRLYPYGDELLYLTKKGNPIDGRSFIKTFKDAARKVGLKEITLHEIRHCVATMLKEANVSAKDAQVILGHSSITTTLQIYTHSTETEKSNALLAVTDKIYNKHNDNDQAKTSL